MFTLKVNGMHPLIGQDIDTDSIRTNKMPVISTIDIMTYIPPTSNHKTPISLERGKFQQKHQHPKESMRKPAKTATRVLVRAVCIASDLCPSVLGAMASSPMQTQAHLSNNVNYNDKSPKEIEVHIAGYTTHTTGLYLSKYKAAFLATAVLLLCLTVVLLVIFMMKRQECEEVVTVLPPTEVPAALRSDVLWKSWRLPTSIVPLFYKLTVQPNILKLELRGYVEITFLCQKRTTFIILQSEALRITQYVLEERQKGTQSVSVPKIIGTPIYSPLYTYITFKLDSELRKGEEYVLRLRYDGSINTSNKGNGIYQTQYDDAKGKTRYMAASFLSPVAARKVFPCFDEPSYKANFNVTIVHRSKYIALSNMPEIPDSREDRGNGWIATNFQTTPKMSTYLLAFIVCNFTSENTLSNGGRVEFRVWARRDAMDQVQYAMDIGPKIFTYLESYAAIPYSLPKMDMIALPFLPAHGMENWGLNTFRESVLLYKEGRSSSRDKQWIAFVIGHELSHQWHSNLVTQAWWDELWLKESFATFMGMKAMDHVHPDFHMTDQQFLTDDLHKVFIVDSLSTSHPVYQTVTTPIEILDNFDMIAYQKGPALVKMMYCFLGEETFKKGLFKYLIDNAYASATSRHLWEAMEWAAKEDGITVDVPSVMDTWLLQMGYPLVTVTRDYTTGSAIISQKHFLMDQDSNNTLRESPYGYKWKVPVTYTAATEPNFDNPSTTWLLQERDELTLTGVGQDEWVVFNINQAFYYRVNYDEKNWDLIINQLNTDHTVITPSQKAAMIDDAFNLAKAGKLNPIIGLRLTEYLKNETEYLPWSAALGALDHLDRLLSHTAAYGVFKQYMRKQVELLYDYVGWNDTGSQLEKYQRVQILITSCQYGHPVCTQHAMKLYREWMDKGTAIAPNLKKAVVCGGIAAGGAEEWDFAWDKYNKSNVASEKSMLIEALTCSSELWILSRYLDMTLDGDRIPPQIALQVYTALSESSLGSYIMWDFFRENWGIISSRYGGGMYQMTPLVAAVTSTFATKFKLQELQYFIDNHVKGTTSDESGFTGTKSFLGALGKTKANVKWLEENLEGVKSWLETAVE
ncbi:aminopeptidase N-like [Glandiceps talaboti]